MTTPEPLAKLLAIARARIPDLMVHRRLACWIFLRLLGLIFIIAFASLFVQIEGLIGEHGIVPANQLLDQIAQNTEGVHWLKVPTLCWISTSDAFLRGLCLIGMITGILLSIGCWPCTRAITLGEDERAGRWSGTNKVECGLHSIDDEPHT